MDTENMSLVAVSMVSAVLAKDVAQLLRDGDISNSLAKELELIKVGEVWEMMFFRTPVTIVSYTGKTADDMVTFSRRGEEETLPIPVFLGSNLHPSLKETNDDEETTTTETESAEQDETPVSPFETFGFKKARKLLKRGYVVGRLSQAFGILYSGSEFVIYTEADTTSSYELTAEDVFADDWCLW